MTALRSLRALLLRTATIFRPERAERDLADEIESHLALHVDDNVRAGMTPAEARRQAVLALGGIEQAKERYRDRRGLPAVEALLQDVRFGARLLRKHPGFTAAAALTLAIGLGPTTAIFALANWAILRPVPGVRAPEAVGLFMTASPTPRGTLSSTFISYPNYEDIAARVRTVSLAGYSSLAAQVAADGAASRPVSGQFVTSSYFSVLGVTMAAGRPFSDGEDNPRDPAMVAVISDSLWGSMFQRDPSAIGRTIRVNGRPVSIVGVTAAGFHGIDRVAQADVWLPGATQPAIRYEPAARGAADRNLDAFYLWAARLQPGGTWPQARTELESLTTWLTEQYPEENGRLRTTRFNFTGPINDVGAARRFVPLFAIAMGVMGIVLLITCSNVACLLLIRGVARRDEVATRAALGAGRWRILRQHITEGLMLWILGAAAGGLLVWAVTRSVAAAGLASLGIRSGQLPIDWRVVVFAGSLPLIVGILFSAIPALRAIRDDVTHALKESGGPTATRSSFAAGSVLTVVQLAASLTLLVGALLLAATLRELSRVDLGFEARGVTTAHVRPSEVGFDVNASFAFYRELLDRIAARPGVESVALAREAPFVGARTRTLIRAAGEPPEASVETATTQVLSPAYFRTLGIRLLRGHPLTADDIRQPGQEAEGGPVILSESLARRLFGTIDVVGRSVEFRRLGDLAPHEVIAVAADVRFFSLTDDPFPMVYDPRGSGLSADRSTVIVRAAPTVDAASEIREAAVAIDADVPIDIVSMSQAIQQARLEWDVLAWLMTSLAGIAIALSMIGVYGVVAFGAAARRREFGIRMAFGARPEMVRRLVLRRAAGLTIAGLALGLAGAYGLARVLENRLVGVTPFDPAIWTLAAASLIAAVVAASILPARNAARLTPADTLRVL